MIWMKKFVRGMLFMLVVAGCFLGSGRCVRAAVVDIQVTNGGYTETSVTIGDTGRIQPVTDSLVDEQGQPVTVARWLYSDENGEYGYGEDDVVSVDENGNYTARSQGQEVILIYGYSEFGGLVFQGRCHITVNIDMTNVTLGADRLVGYVTGYDSFTGKIPINSAVILTQDNSVVTYQSDDDEMSVSCEVMNNELWISTYADGDAKLTVTINGKEFVIYVKVSRLEMSKSGFVAAKGKKTKLKVKGTREKVAWTSSNSSVVKVSKDGTIRCRKIGNAVITAKLGEVRVGCAVSVISPKLLKVVNAAKKMGANWKYSQPKRMQKGYYDCSSLVWKAYKKAGKTFGNSHYAPVAADEAKWCASHKKMITKSYTWNQIQKMKLRPGDLIFKTGQKNGRYKGIYHVEMFVGYTVTGYDESGKPILYELWAARQVGYGGGGFPVARP